MKGFTSLLPLILLIVIMYLLLIRPQKKREKAVNAMREALRSGDKIVTIGGIHGKIIKIKDDILSIQVGADKTKLEISRWAVSSVVNDDTDARVKEAKAEAEEEAEAPVVKRPRRLEKTAAPAADPAETAEEETSSKDTPEKTD
jgi:preprotein translocase subunit YajC